VNYENLVTFSVNSKEDMNKRRMSTMDAVVGDNIGDAFKDITGPAINTLIKFSSIFSLVIVSSFDIN
jgi:Na+/H+-translocating membrane pyrophosphatase